MRTALADLQAEHDRLTAVPIAAELPAAHVAMLAEHAVMPAEHPEAAHQQHAADLAAADTPVVDSAAAADMPAVAADTAAADTAKKLGLRGSPQITAEIPGKARLLRQTGLVFFASKSRALLRFTSLPCPRA